MARSHGRRTLAMLGMAVVLAPMVSCLDAGLPWGWLEASLEARFDPSADRLDEGGRVKTSQNYVVQVDHARVTFDAVTVALAASGVSAFDPANPPPGYSLCHNGHCHSDSGELVDYEVIALETAGGKGGARISIGLDGTPTNLSATASAIGVTPCDPSPCELPRGELAGLELVIASLSVSGTAFDTLPGDSARLPTEGLPFSVEVPVSSPLSAQLEGTIGHGAPLGLSLAMEFELSEQLFDGIDFGDAPPQTTEAWQSALSEPLLNKSEFTVIVERFTE